MATPFAGPYKHYLETQVETASPEKLLLMLYRSAVQRCREARKAMAEGDRETAHTNLIKVQQILTELMAALNWEAGGEITRGLYGVYDYMHRKLVEANLKGCADGVAECEKLLSELLDAWERALSGEAEEAAGAVPAAAGLNLRG